MENPDARTVVFAVAAVLVLGCAPAPPPDDEDPGSNGTVVAQAPEPVHVTFTKTDEGCEITCEPPQVTLHKNWMNGPHQAIWTWEGPYERAWVVFGPDDLRKCLDGNNINSVKRGFEILQDGTTKTVNPAPDCRIGYYDYELRAVTAEGDVCGVDPKVRIED